MGVFRGFPGSNRPERNPFLLWKPEIHKKYAPNRWKTSPKLKTTRLYCLATSVRGVEEEDDEEKDKNEDEQEENVKRSRQEREGEWEGEWVE